MLKNVLKIILIVMVVLAIIILLFISFWSSLGKKPSKDKQASYYKRTSLYTDGIFKNIEEFDLMVDVKDSLSDKSEVKKKPSEEIPVVKINELEKANISEMKIIWFGHSTTLVQIHGMNILIDPVLSDYASPVSFIGPKRMADIPMEPEDLPEIDLVLISHDHYDHLDYKTIKEIDHKVKAYAVPLGVESHLESWNIEPNKINSMAWLEEINVNGLNVALTPSKHFTGRLPWNMNSTLWGGFVLRDEYHSLYYSGDTGYGEHFKDIYNNFGEIELVLIESGQYDERWPNVHMNPNNAFKALEDLNAKWAIPVHWGGFVLANHSWYEPAEELSSFGENSEISIATPRIGEIVNVENLNEYQEKWWRDIE